MLTVTVKDDLGEKRDFYKFQCRVDFGVRNLFIVEGFCSMCFSPYPIMGTYDINEAAAEIDRLNSLLEANLS